MRPVAPLSLALALAYVATACQPRAPVSVGAVQAPRPAHLAATPPTVTPPEAAPPAPNASAPTAPVAPSFGEPVSLGRLALYPITLAPAAQVDPGPLVLLDEALRTGAAEVREVGQGGAAVNDAAIEHLENRGFGTDPGARAAVEAARRRDRGPQAPLQVEELAPAGNVQALGNEAQQQVQQRGGGAQVNTLVIENKGKVPVFVMAGTVVKGGNQDRQIGQDFVVDAGETVPVDAFCVEHGRWDASRQGADTAGRFGVVPALATSKVRAAGQYRKSQQEVWDNVAEVNKAHAKSADSGTLLATFDDPAVVRRLDELAHAIATEVGARAPASELVGLAWAVDGKVQGVRWFAHARVMGLVSAKLARAAAVDALTAEAAGPGTAVPTPTPTELAAFVAEVERQVPTEKRETAGANDNIYRESERAWGSRTLLKAKADRPARPLAFDYLAK